MYIYIYMFLVTFRNKPYTEDNYGVHTLRCLIPRMFTLVTINLHCIVIWNHGDHQKSHQTLFALDSQNSPEDLDSPGSFRAPFPEIGGGGTDRDAERTLGVPVGVNPIERRTIPAEGRDPWVVAIGPLAKSGLDREGSSLGLDSTCHRSDVDPGRAKSGAMLMEAYLR